MALDLNKKNIKRIMLLIAFAALLYWGLNNLKWISGVLGSLLDLLSPLLIGICIAFVLNLMMVALERLWDRGLIKWNSPWNAKLKRPVCLTLTLLLFLGIIFAIFFILIPRLEEAGTTMVANIPTYVNQIQVWWTNLSDFAAEHGVTLPELSLSADQVKDTITGFLQEKGDSVVNTTLNITTSILSALVNFLLALVFCGLITTLLTSQNPLSVYGTILDGAFGSSRRIGVTFRNTAVLLGISLAVTPAFKMRFWNIGAEGQTLIGCLATTTCMILLGGKVSNFLLIVISLAAALLAGAVWGFLPAFFKARWNTNETLFTLMMNYIAMQLASYFIIIWEVPKGAGKIGIINQASEAGWLPRIGGQAQLLPILVVALLTGMMYIYLTYSKHGYEIAVVGESQRTASYAGIKVDRVIIRTMVLSGAICGLMGYILTAGISHTLTTTIVDSRGFTAVMVSWMSKFNPFIMIAASLLLVTMDRGAGEISTAFSLNQSFADILTGIILFFIIATEFFITYKVTLRKSSKKEA